ncbi:MAG: uroporphyrinogen-III C-methyltransferase [Propionibacteriaceae bacterium]|nr:uroporphyrinogen-III C-methyltransferase [Propionibacteriaceae bacterium]
MTAPAHVPGRVTLVGGGPGDPDLLTIAGLRALQSADVILTDHLAPDVTGLVDGTEIVNVGKTPHGPATPQEEINALLIEHARSGRHAVRLKGGDPFVFGRGGEEFLACSDAGVPVSVVPGVSSAVAAPELAGIPVTHRGMSQGFTVVSGHVAPDDPRSHISWAALAQSQTTLVLLMGVRQLPAITAALADGGLPADTPAAIVTKAASPDMAVVRGTLATIADLAVSSGVRPPSITVIGDVAALDLRG